jgi:16S rRNA (uracil1498-N3)-methyltransferase
MRRFYAPREKISSKKIILSPEETHHLISVDRFKKGDMVLVFDGEGGEYEAIISNVEKAKTILDIKKKIKREEDDYILRVAVCLPKKGKFETIIEKCTELNADEIVPIISERTIVKIDDSKTQIKLGRWEKKAIEAAKQSNRARLPKIYKAQKFDEFIKKIAQKNSFILMPTVYSNHNFKNTLKNIKTHKDITILIGPEGGFSLQEVKLAESKGAILVNLGRAILRTETAVFFTLSVINYELAN